MAKESGCANCRMRARYEARPQSLLGRLWHWHAGWCPGWKRYMASLPDGQRRRIARRYGLKKFMH